MSFNKPIKLSLINFAALLVSISLVLYFMIVAKAFLIPIIFGLLFCFLLHPIRKGFLKYVKFDGIAIALALITIIAPVSLIITFFTVQISEIISSLPSITNSLEKGLTQAIEYVSARLPVSDIQKDNFMSQITDTLIATPMGIIQESLVSSSTMLFNIALTFLYTIFFLYYFDSFKNFLLYQTDEERRPRFRVMLRSIQRLTQQYISGLGIVILILAVLNSIGLAIIGVEYAIFWGVLAACMVVVPYIGTTLGGTLPFLYALATSGTLWQPIAVVIFYASLQQIEGNIITPKVVGNQVDINPMIALIAIVFFGTVWGVAGIVLALPMVAILRIIMENINVTKPIAVLLGSDIHEDENIFRDVYDDDKYRLKSLFYKNKKEKELK